MEEAKRKILLEYEDFILRNILESCPSKIDLNDPTPIAYLLEELKWYSGEDLKKKTEKENKWNG